MARFCVLVTVAVGARMGPASLCLWVAAVQVMRMLLTVLVSAVNICVSLRIRLVVFEVTVIVCGPG